MKSALSKRELLSITYFSQSIQPILTVKIKLNIMGNSFNFLSNYDDPVHSDLEHEECEDIGGYNIDSVEDSECQVERVQEVLEGGVSRLYKQPRYKPFPMYHSRFKNNKYLENLKTEAEEAIENCKKRKREYESVLPPHKKAKAMLDVNKSIQRCWMCRKTFIEEGGSWEGECVCQTNICHICGVPFKGHFSIVDHLACLPSYRESLE